MPRRRPFDVGRQRKRLPDYAVYSFCIVFPDECCRRKIAQTRLLANVVIKDLDVFGDFAVFVRWPTRAIAYADVVVGPAKPLKHQ